MSKFDKLLDHPEKDKILGKLVSGDSPKEVAQWLKVKYHQSDEGHLRLSSSMLKEFTENYLSHADNLVKIIEDEKNGKLDKKIADSLINNKTWRERMAEFMDDEIDLKKHILKAAFMIEARIEQVWDKIQENPGNFKGDYVLNKYFEQWTAAIEKADKIINERPDKLIQQDITINMVEQHSVVFQEAIRDLLLELDPEISARFMELLTEKLAALKAGEEVVPRSIDDRRKEVEKLMPAEEGDDGT